MELLAYWQSLDPVEKLAFASKAGTSRVYLSQLAHGHRQAGYKSIRNIEMASDGAVTEADLRPEFHSNSL